MFRIEPKPGTSGEADNLQTSGNMMFILEAVTSFLNIHEEKEC